MLSIENPSIKQRPNVFLNKSWACFCSTGFWNGYHLPHLRWESVGAKNIKILAEDPNTGVPSSFTFRMEYFFSILIFGTLCWKPMRGEWGGREKAESILLLIFVSSRESYLGPAEIAPISRRVLSRRNKDDSFWLVVSIDWIFLHFISMSHCCFRFSSLGNQNI